MKTLTRDANDGRTDFRVPVAIDHLCDILEPIIQLVERSDDFFDLAPVLAESHLMDLLTCT